MSSIGLIFAWCCEIHISVFAEFVCQGARVLEGTS